MRERKTENRNPGKAVRRCFGPALTMLVVLMLSGCGKASAMKLTEVETLLKQLSETRNHAVEVYDTLYDDTLYAPLQEASKKVDGFAAIDATEMTDEEIDTQLLPDMRELEGVLRELQDQLDATAASEEEERRMLEGKKSVTFFVVNRSGRNIRSLDFFESSDGGETKLLTIPTPLADNETLAGITVMVTDGQAAKLWLSEDSAEKTEEVEEIVGETAEETVEETAEETPAPAAEKTGPAEGHRYEIARSDDLEPEKPYYLVLLPDDQFTLKTEP